MRTLLCMFLIAAMAVLLAGQDTRKVSYVYCSSRDNPVLTAMVYSSPPTSIPLGHLNCGDKVKVLGRTESWIRIASDEGERYVPMTTLSQRKAQFVALDIPLSPEPRPNTGKVIPRLISSPNAKYTHEAQKAQVQGLVILKVTIGADGNVRNVSVLKGLGYGLEESAMNAVLSWKFEPALQDGVPVDFNAAVEVEFPPATNR